MLNSMLKIYVGPVMGGFEPPPTPRQYATDVHRIYQKELHSNCS
jgi:hypothetical protein